MNKESPKIVSTKSLQLFVLIFCYVLFGNITLAEEVGKWKKFEATYVNTTFSGNPFDLDVKATFVHTASGKTIVRSGFYAGSDTWKNRSIPTFFTDRWSENDSRGDFDSAKIKQAVWQMGLVGGTGVYISGNENGGYLTETYQSDFTVAPQIGVASRFFKNNINNFGLLNPHDELIVSGNGVLSALPGEEYVAYLPEGGDVKINLIATSGTYEASWFNPRDGNLTSLGLVSDGVRTFSAEDTNDWVLHVKKSVVSSPSVTRPTGLKLNIN